MSYLLVCRLDQIAETAVRHGAREMISLVAPGQSFHRPAVIAPERHLKLGVNDITEAGDGLVAPAELHVRNIIDFARAWNRSAPLIVHCWFGISRSPAAALVTALALDPEQDDRALARRMRKASPYVTPNPGIVGFGDRLLGRRGRLVAAVEEIGRGAEASQGDVFRFDISPAEVAGG
ncbi:MAG: protein tyrosine phosphatase [Rhizobiales bacterium]|nr:protein tyrosine phosphatase [Hyphomicrobiales bacterium]MBA70647.1 protein tyrosine phosphatase [Hyphomicrobiales bacterium]